MPKLNQNQQQVVEDVDPDAGGFTLYPEGYYILELAKVEVKDGKAADQWEITWKVVEDVSNGVHVGKRFMDWISLSDAAAWRVRQFFDAMGFTPDSDTDEMIGEKVGAYLTQREQEVGKNAGKVQNRVDRYVDPSGE